MSYGVFPYPEPQGRKRQDKREKIHMERTYSDFLEHVARRKRLPDDVENAYFSILARKDVPERIKDECRRRIVDNHVPFVISVANNYSSCNSSRGDLVNVGIVGLRRAVDTFRPERGVKFISYAVWWVRQVIYKYVYDDALIRVPLNQRIAIKKLMKKAAETGSQLQELVAGRPDEKALADALAALDLTSIDTPVKNVEDNDVLLSDVLSGPDLNTELDSDDAAEKTRKLLEVLDEKDRNVISSTYGLDGQELTLAEIGEINGGSREWIRVIRNRAMRRLSAVSRKSPIARELMGLKPLNIQPDSKNDQGGSDGNAD